ncbi:MAG: winged helix DNA-binding protein [Haliscomenobacter sp.]|nr:winged helix DNA-binding protein [Haliscomenobacter sp.]MBK7477444.1 winged helix DNA-binding protein [Haliscomenobacter sp.]
MRIEEAIQQKRFRSEYQKVVVNILYTASWLSQMSARMLKSLGISPEQYNLLRILRGMHPEPATVKLLTDRMIDKMSNASRLVEKLRLKGLVERTECPADRRRVDVRITEKGLALLKKADVFMEDDLELQLTNLDTAEAEQLNALLDQLRG